MAVLNRIHSILEYGADPTGTRDSTTAIQNAINVLPATGGTVLFPPGTYKVSSTINVGNGTSSSGSTIQGITLIGIGQPPMLLPGFFGGFSQVAPVHLEWTGGASTMISINGPLQGWAISNLWLDGGGSATTGIQITSAQYGDTENIVITGCTTSGIYSTTVAPFGLFLNTDSLHNTFRNISITAPLTSLFNCIVLTGTGTSADTDCNVFINTTLCIPSGANNSSVGITLQACDSNLFYGLQIINASGSSTSHGVVFDYTVANIMPTGNGFYGIDTKGAATPFFANSGTPASTARPNFLCGVIEANGGVNPLNIPNLSASLPVVVGGTILTAQTDAISATTLVTSYALNLYRLNVYVVVTTAGNKVKLQANVFWNDGTGTQSISTASIACNATNYAQRSAVIAVASGTAVQYTTTLSGAIGTGQYSLLISLEKLT
jgi:hypothetical protein